MATKPTTPRSPKSAAKPANKAKQAKIAIAADVAPVEGEANVAAAGLHLKDLVDMVAASTSLKKKDVKTVLDAALAQIAAALTKSAPLNLPGLGKLRVARVGEAGSAMTLKLRMGGGAEKGEKAAVAPLADGEDQD